MRTLIRTSTPCCHRNALCIRLYSSARAAAPSPQRSFGTTFNSTTTTVTTGTRRRYFITLPKLPQLPNLLKPLSSSRHYKDRTLLKYSQQEFYDLVANVDDYHKFLPWCTYSKMSAPLSLGSASECAGSEVEKTKFSDVDGVVVKGGGEVTVRHGELGIGFNSLQDRYVSTVTCQEPWMVRAVSYDSKLFKELSTTWRFTPNIPKTTTLEATMDQEVQESQLLTRPAADDADDEEKNAIMAVSPESQDETVEVVQQPSSSVPTPAATIATPKEQQQPKHYFTAAAVFGEAALPRPRTAQSASPPSSPSSPPSSPPASSPGTPTISIPVEGQLTSTTSTTTTTPSPPPLRSSPLKQVILQRTASPSNLTTMKPSDYPSCWIDFEIEFEFASPVHASMSSLFFDQVSKDMLAAFVKRAEILYGQR
ncbi:Coenzyme Q-binding protein coq10a, mitochondrial [Linnemannia gamsii]|uniref:Coenzyme Q-binding protein coq10a, mitochondrial n=1 Tax=Linnemannia gamsii TaxID=64522 RepID=A0A9P6R2Z8_9FUNG|nr:Coenzyme Q-binding protein coq10a, mitochondrial [Linnemannia gamsii]